MIPLTITHSYFYHFNTILLMQRAFPPSLSLKWLFFTFKKKNQSTIYWVTIMDYCHHLALVWFLLASATLLYNISVYDWNGKFSIQTTTDLKGELKLSKLRIHSWGGTDFQSYSFYTISDSPRIASKSHSTDRQHHGYKVPTISTTPYIQ